MSTLRCQVAALIVVALAVASPLLAADVPTTDPISTPQASQLEPARPGDLPAEIPGLEPEPNWLYGRLYGPCTVSVTCTDPDHTVISCTGRNICDWKVDGAPGNGFVRCDGHETPCPLL